MVITVVEANEVLRATRTSLGLPSSGAPHDPVLLAALVRRAGGILCPCSSQTLARAVLEALDQLVENPETLSDDVDEAIESAMIAGDLLELSQVTTEDASAKGTWVFAAPPAFVARPSGTVFLLGITPDESNPLPPSLARRVVYDRHYRLIVAEPGENLPATLRELGVLELSERTWLKLPREEAAKEFRDRLERELKAQPPSGDVRDLLILDSSRDPGYYRGRWVTPKRESGCFVARRPQAYGAPIWGFAFLDDSVLTRFIDFPPKGSPLRGSDFAWHLQMAIDYCRGTPQQYRLRSTPSGPCLDFYSPLPLWAERRLALIGQTAERERCLFSYRIPEREVAAEEDFLAKRLWLARRQ